jgi:hypothetical protein
MRSLSHNLRLTKFVDIIFSCELIWIAIGIRQLKRDRSICFFYLDEDEIVVSAPIIH